MFSELYFTTQPLYHWTDEKDSTGHCVEKHYDDVSIEPEYFSQPFYCIGSFKYSWPAVVDLKSKINSILSNIECLSVKYQPGCYYKCTYGTIGIISTLTMEQKVVYNQKNTLFNTGYVIFLNMDEKNKINFRTVAITQRMGVPFNYFKKKGITEKMRRDLLKEITNKSLKMFPNNFQEDEDLDNLWDEDIEYYLDIITPNREWSYSEVCLRKNNDTINIYFNRVSGDRTSANYIFGILKEEMKSYLPQLKQTTLLWNWRRNYLMFMEGYLQNDFEEKSKCHITRYIYNEMITREICSFVF